jgi:hypothetical protein
MATISNPPIVQEIIEESKPIVETDSPITKRKNRKNNNLEITTAVTPSPSVKKSRPRRFVWTLDKVIILFGLFSIITVALIVYMFKQIS